MSDVKVTKIGDGALADEDSVVLHGLDPRRPWRYVMQFRHEDFGGAILEDDDGAALVWNDFVVNQWVELYSHTHLAMMRLAVMMFAAEGEDSLFFTQDRDGFAKSAVEFLQRETG